jgi:two-component system, cell cycle sensor histidine kinase and response regulator CckA
MSDPVLPSRDRFDADLPSSSGIAGSLELVDAIPLPVWMGDEQGRTVYLNRAWRDFSGRPLAQDLGEGWFELVHQADRARVRDHFAALVASGDPLTCDYRARRADGEYRLLRDQSQARLDANGRVSGFMGTRTDVTETYETEKRLTLETLRQASLINFGRRTLDDPPFEDLAQEATRTLSDSLALPCALLLLRGTPGDTLRVIASTGLTADSLPNPRELEGPDPGHLVLPDDALTFPVPPEWTILHGFRSGFAVPLGEGGRADGYLIGLATTEDGHSGANLLFARHLSHFVQTMLVRDRARMAQRESNERALQSQKMEAVGLLAGGVAHDFNNLLTAIRCFGELLREDLTQDADRAKMDDILHAANHASHLVRQLLTFSRKNLQEPETIELNQLLEDLRSFIRSLLSENIALDIQLSKEPVHIRADRNQVEQVIFNLCLNARDAMATGGSLAIRVGTRTTTPTTHPRLSSGRYVELRIADTGCGMSSEVQARVFEPFFTTKPHGRGTGLGLSTCMNIARGCGGDITVVSAPGLGTEFTVLLPEAQASDEPAFDEVPFNINIGSGRLMVVDDDDMVRAVAKSLLETLGYQVTAFASTEAALEFAQTPEFHSIQVLVTDIVMPVMNGHELSRRLVALNPQLKTLFMSGYIEDPAIQSAILDPSVMFLAKPFSTAELAERVAKLLV